MPLHNVYSASKAYLDFLSRALSYEYQKTIDIISLRPSEVSTPMTHNKKTDLLTILPEDCARGLLNDLGHERVTNGHISHCLQGYLYHLLPECFFNYVFLNFVGPDFIREREAAVRKQR
jgi:17beta-estradiol 17-dehydrogenase / very-long-chain 3-oxoacyl-CoA reductase